MLNVVQVPTTSYVFKRITHSTEKSYKICSCEWYQQFNNNKYSLILLMLGLLKKPKQRFLFLLRADKMKTKIMCFFFAFSQHNLLSKNVCSVQ